MSRLIIFILFLISLYLLIFMSEKSNFEISGEGIKEKGKELLNEGSAWKLIIKSTNGRIIFETILIVAIIIALAAPYVSIPGIILALITKHKISIKKK